MPTGLTDPGFRVVAAPDEPEERIPRRGGRSRRHGPDGRPARPRTSREPFVSGPIPLAWIAAAGRISLAASAVAWSVWHARGLKHRDEALLLSLRGGAARVGLHRRTFRRGLLALHAAGLIRIVSSRGRQA